MPTIKTAGAAPRTPPSFLFNPPKRKEAKKTAALPAVAKAMARQAGSMSGADLVAAITFCAFEGVAASYHPQAGGLIFSGPLACGFFYLQRELQSRCGH
jgi:hypothetical protein